MSEKTDSLDEGTTFEEKKHDSDAEIPPLKLPSRFLSLDSVLVDGDELKEANKLLIEKLVQSLRQIDATIRNKIDVLESLDVTTQIVDYRILEATQEFKSKFREMQDERDQLLSSAENKSELSLLLNSLDKKILNLETDLQSKIKGYNLEKIDYQEKSEALILQLEEDFIFMREKLKEMKDELEGKETKIFKAQFILINERYAPIVEEFEQHLLYFEKLQINGWKTERSEVKLSDVPYLQISVGVLREKGVTLTSSGKLLTRSGSTITFQEAQARGYFTDFRVSLDKIIAFFKEHDQQQDVLDQIGQPDTDAGGYSEGNTIDSSMSSEDVRYLKQYVGKPLALGLAEIIAKHPRDPIHYLGHYLFKYRYNQELEEIQKREVDELTNERKIVAQERWKRFVEEEARKAVIDMVLRTEQIAYENELKRIEREQMLAEEENEMEEKLETKELLEEARDKFE